MTYSIEPIPTWALCYLINSDRSGLSFEDVALIERWCTKNRVSVLATADGQEGGDAEPYFSHYPAFGLPTDVVNCHVIIH